MLKNFIRIIEILMAVGLGRHNGVGSLYFVCGGKLEEDYLEAMSELEDLYPKEIVDVYRKLGGTPEFDMKFNIIGHIFYGLDVAMDIHRLGLSEDFNEDIIIEKVELIKFEGK